MSTEETDLNTFWRVWVMEEGEGAAWTIQTLERSEVICAGLWAIENL